MARTSVMAAMTAIAILISPLGAYAQSSGGAGGGSAGGPASSPSAGSGSPAGSPAAGTAGAGSAGAAECLPAPRIQAG
jgi:hypothetical protein